MKVSITTINARFTHSSLALRYLRDSIETEWKGKPDRVVKLREYFISQKHLDILYDMVLAEPDVLLLSVYIWNSRSIKNLLPDIHALLPDCIIVLGGPEVSYYPQKWFDRFPFINAIVSGAGEEAVRHLASIDFNIRGTFQQTLTMPVPDFSHVPFPYRDEDYINLENRYLYYESSRGCPFSCSYCLSSREDNPLSLKNLTTTCTELAMLLMHKPRLIKFVDRSFNANPERARGIWNYLILHHGASGARFHFEIHPLLLGEEDFNLLAQAPDGLFQFEIGVQSIHQRTLDAIHRPSDWVRTRSNIERLTAGKNIHIHLDLIAGLPFESIKEIAASFDEIISLKSGHFQLGFLKGLPGTELLAEFSDAKLHHNDMVFMHEAPYEIIRSRWLTALELSKLKNIAVLVENITNTHRYDTLMQAGAIRQGGHFPAYSHLLMFCEETGFDINTRNEEKVRKMLESWLGR